MSIKTKMILGIIGTLVLLLLGNLATQYLTNQTNKTLSIVIDVNGEKLALLNHLKNTSDRREIQLLNLVLFDEDEEGYDEKMAKGRDVLKETADDIFKIFERLNKIDLNAEESKIYEELKANVASANTSFGSFMTAINEGFRDEAVVIMQEEFRPKYQSFADIVEKFRDYEITQNSLAIENLHAEQEQSSVYLWGGFAVIVVLFSIIGFLVMRSLLKPITEMENTMLKIVETGELKHRIKVYGKDELAITSQAVNALLEDISRSVFSVNDVLKDVSKGQFDSEVSFELKGDFMQMKNEVNSSVHQIRSVMNVIEKTAQNFRAGVLEVDKDDSIQLEGKFADVLYDLERSAVLMKSSVNSIAETLNYLSHGDFSVRSEADVLGDFIPLKESLNLTLNDLESFVEEVAKVQASISEGDLTKIVSGTYSGKMAVLKDSLNSSVKNTAVMVAKVEAITQSVVSGVQNLAQGNSEISNRVQEQAAALEETSASMEEMTSAVRQNADNAFQAKEKTTDASHQLEAGLVTMQKALNSMSEMSAASQKINDITTLIDGIAFQTNLLALNAAVEAARAGEHGRGFAVVAGEVRNLAGKSAEAAGEIKHLIENSVKISEESGLYVGQTSEVLSTINATMLEVSEMVADISGTSEEQARGVEQVNSAVMSMDEMTQKNAAIVQTAAESSKALLDNAGTLQEQVSLFNVDNVVSQRMAKLINSKTASQFEKMIEAHLAWKGKIRAYVEGVDIGVTYESATDHTACILGKWYYSDGQAFMHIPQMVQLGDEHMQMHQGIKTVMDAKSINDIDTVEAGLAEIDVQSEKVVELLYQIIDQLA
ncbi:methyl-accepting chemotaxis protein [Thiomicrorhabdus sp. Kp2]|uniref:methyl-accepting chemotaxis protein n=1 Tax=Thiomicrorhabdus sp. Kp2 TaxID=1123518 RepID=UPI00042730C7|nr:methyl-accepting chemotaxis protein [Thiomicrorhabdus sp. Kp2]